jgi:hypothetical protein
MGVIEEQHGDAQAGRYGAQHLKAAVQQPLHDGAARRRVQAREAMEMPGGQRLPFEHRKRHQHVLAHRFLHEIELLVKSPDEPGAGNGWRAGLVRQDHFGQCGQGRGVGIGEHEHRGAIQGTTPARGGPAASAGGERPRTGHQADQELPARQASDRGIAHHHRGA